jgi:hypothetical protein
VTYGLLVPINSIATVTVPEIVFLPPGRTWRAAQCGHSYAVGVFTPADTLDYAALPTLSAWWYRPPP